MFVVKFQVTSRRNNKRIVSEASTESLYKTVCIAFLGHVFSINATSVTFCICNRTLKNVIDVLYTCVSADTSQKHHLALPSELCS